MSRRNDESMRLVCKRGWNAFQTLKHQVLIAFYVAPTVATTAGGTCQNKSFSDKIGKVCGPTEAGSENEKTLEKPGLNASGQYWIRTGDLCRVKAAL